MAFTCVYEGMIISEGRLEQAQALGSIEADLSFRLGAQLKSLRDVKSELAMQARALGANAIESFTYGQKHRWLAIDDVAFWGKGVAVRLPADVADTYINQ